MPAHLAGGRGARSRPRLLSRQLAWPWGETDWDLIPCIVADDFTFVTNNARDFRKLYAKEGLHAGLVIIVPQVLPGLQRELFTAVLHELADAQEIVNEVVEIAIEDSEVILTRYALPE